MPIESEVAGRTVVAANAPAGRPIQPALLRGARLLCPACGIGRLFRSYLKVTDTCSHCGQELHHQRADDAPAYFTMVIVGHIVVGGLLMVEQAYAPPTWLQLAIWLPLTLILSLALLPVVKGMLVNLQWALRMHGFGKGADPAPDPALAVTLGTKGRPA